MLPVRMVNEYQYCPRLAYLEWVQKEWEDSADTVEGRYRHRQVDQPQGNLPDPENANDMEAFHARSITLSSSRLRLIARMDLIEGHGNQITPIEYKRGKRPHVEKGAYEPERVQLCAQGLILEEHGYHCKSGIIYFCESRERVPVRFDDELKKTTWKAIHGLRHIASGNQIPEPLQDSPKCPRCSLVSICLPDEVRYLNGGEIKPRPLVVARDEALPVYVQAHRAKISKKGEVLEISIGEEKISSARLNEVSQVVILGGAYITAPCLQALMRRQIPVTWHSFGGWFIGHTIGTGHKNVELRTAQYRKSFDDIACLALAKEIVRAKLLNCRTLLRRNWREADKPLRLLQSMKRDAALVSRTRSLEELLGIEGNGAARYFANLASLLKTNDRNPPVFDFTARNRRPPTDPVNALLSFAYTLLARAWTVTLSAVGFDPYRGFYHQPRYGRPALALDMMEPFRPLIADSCVIQAINNGEIKPDDFVSIASNVNLTSSGRKRFIGTFERRMSQEIIHPLFGYRVSYRRLLELESRLLGRFLLGELPAYTAFRTR